MENLFDGLYEEIQRVKEVKQIYEKTPNTQFALEMVINPALNRAEKAFKSQEMTDMMRSYMELQEINC